MLGRDIIKKLKHVKNDETTIKVQDGDTIVELKTNNFHHLVKKFAKRMFVDMKVDVKSGK
jgi:competence transcription factor ComK